MSRLPAHLKRLEALHPARSRRRVLDSGSALHTHVMKTEALRQALARDGFDAAIGSARRDEEKSRAKERIFSFRSSQHGWDPKSQRTDRRRCGG